MSETEKAPAAPAPAEPEKRTGPVSLKVHIVFLTKFFCQDWFLLEKLLLGVIT